MSDRPDLGDVASKLIFVFAVLVIGGNLLRWWLS